MRFSPSGLLQLQLLFVLSASTASIASTASTASVTVTAVALASASGFASGFSSISMASKFHFCIDRGGTFTDVHCILPDGTQIVRKLLSEDPSHYPDAPTEGIRRILAEFTAAPYPRGTPVPTHQIGSIRMGTTVATNALLERDGSRMALLITRGFQDLLEIGNQARPDIFDLTCQKPSVLYETVLEVDERIILDEFCTTAPDPAVPVETGITGERVRLIKAPDLPIIKAQLEQLKQQGITALAICFMHSFVYSDHEIMVGKVAEEVGFEQISLSSQVMPMVKIVSRYVPACLPACLRATFLIVFHRHSF